MRPSKVWKLTTSMSIHGLTQAPDHCVGKVEEILGLV